MSMCEKDLAKVGRGASGRQCHVLLLAGPSGDERNPHDDRASSASTPAATALLTLLIGLYQLAGR